MVTITHSILKYLARHIEGTDGISAIVLDLRAVLLRAMLGSFALLDVPGRVDKETMADLRDDFRTILKIIQKHTIYLSVLREVKREVDKLAKGFSRGHFNGIRRSSEAWVDFESKLVERLAIAGTDIVRQCDNNAVRSA